MVVNEAGPVSGRRGGGCKALAGVLGLALAVLASPAGAVTYTVTTASDTVSSDSQCSLREAIQEANNGSDTDCGGSPNSGNDLIVFHPSVTTITLGSSLPPIVSGQGTLTIDGGGNVTISGNNSVRVMVVNSGADLTLRNLTVANGNAIGSPGADFGGGVRNAGRLTITGSTFSSNAAFDGGGGVANAGTLSISNSTFSDNRATSSSGIGGGLLNVGSATVIGSTFQQNSAGDEGGGVFNSSGATLTITGSTFSDNLTVSGGAVYNVGSLQITDSTFSDNQVTGNGGGAYNTGMLTITASTFSGNNVTSLSSGDGGGGVFNASGGTLIITNSTFSGNRANLGGGGGIRVAAGNATLKNTIIANSPSGGDCVGTLTGSNLHNLIEDSANACGLTDGLDGNIIGQDPQLDPLTGSPAYFPLQLGSPARDAGHPGTCQNPPVSNRSQNGIPRPQDGDGNGVPVCDIGSFEALGLEADMMALGGTVPAVLEPGGSYSLLSFRCRNLGADAASQATCGVSVSAGSVSGVSCTPSVPTTSPLPAGEIIDCTFTYTAPGTPGGSDTAPTGAVFTFTAGSVTSDPIPGNNTATSGATPIPLVDALDDAASFPASTVGATYNVGANDQYGTGSLPGTASFTLLPATTCTGASINATTGVATFNVPASGTCVVAYQVCVSSACDTAQLTVTAQHSDMSVAFGSLPSVVSPGGSYPGLIFTCTNDGPGAAVNATCGVSVSAGSVSAVNCMPSVPTTSPLPLFGVISCTYTFTAPGSQGGGDTLETGVSFTFTTDATNDSNATNNTVSSGATPIPLVDALDDAVSLPGGIIGATFDVGANDQLGASSPPAGASYSLLAGTTCSGASIGATSGVATFNVPALATCVVVYRVCVSEACDTAQLVVTGLLPPPRSIPMLGGWALIALGFWAVLLGWWALKRHPSPASVR
ncbi:MAG: hypothetical protein KatS3mg125_1152 [Lysobacterales bacterium]|nr:MAG: hypothetical protein KatS3mg125_1152 [Xanthomonadales bacterium]